MKKLLAITFVAMALNTMAQYNSMQFNNNSGESYFAGLKDLEIRFSEGNLIATWENNGSLTLPLANLKSMQFSADEAGISEILSGISDIEVFNLDGIYQGKYENIYIINETLPEGIYILKTSDGLTSKIIVGK